MPLYQESKAEIVRMLENGVISSVNEPNEWCAPMVVTPKANNKVRVCVNLTKLYNFVQIDRYMVDRYMVYLKLHRSPKAELGNFYKI